MTHPLITMAQPPAPPRRVALEHPIEVPGGALSTLMARPFFPADGELLAAGGNEEIRAVANALFTSPEVVLELSDLDFANARDSIRQAATDYIRTGSFFPLLRTIEGGAQ